MDRILSWDATSLSLVVIGLLALIVVAMIPLERRVGHRATDALRIALVFGVGSAGFAWAALREVQDVSTEIDSPHWAVAGSALLAVLSLTYGWGAFTLRRRRHRRR